MLRKSRFLPSTRCGLAAGLLGTLVLPAAGALAADEDVGLEEIVVTAQKREQSLQDVGISVAAFSGDQLADLGLSDTTAITQQIPSLQMNAWSPTLTVFNLRGVSQNSFTDNLEAPVAVYVDDAYVSSMNAISGQMFDMKRIEVLRGPQGTLFGRNATGGLVHFLTNTADESQLNGYVEVAGASYNRKSIEGAIGGGLSDRVRGRIAGRWEKADGYVKAVEPTARSIGGADGYALRGALQVDATDNLVVDVLYKYSKDSDVPTGGYVFLPFGEQNQAYVPPEWIPVAQDILGGTLPPEYANWTEATAAVFFCPDQLACFAASDPAGLTIFRGDSPEPYRLLSGYRGFMNRDIHNGTIKLRGKLGSVDVVSITNMMKLDKFYTEDGDGLPIPIIEFTTANNMKQWSEELRFSGQTDRFRWQAGAYYLDIDIDAYAITVGAPVFNLAQDLLNAGDIDEIGDLPAINQIYQLGARNWSLFSQVEYDFADHWTAIAGLRWSQDDKKLRFRSLYSDSLNNVPGFNLQEAIAAAGGGDQDTVDYGDYAARLQLNWKPTSDVLLFTSYNRGIKGGNFNPAANVQLDNVKHNEEVLHSFELGAKTTFFGGRARLNATAFYYDYQDYQVFALVGGQPQVANSDATVQGGEIEFFLKPSRHWDVALGASFLDSSIDAVPVAGLQVPPAGLPIIDWPVDVVRDREMPNAPSYSFNYLVRYNWDVFTSSMAVQVDGVQYADQYLEATNGGGSFQKAYGITNAHLNYSSPGEHFRVDAWVKNLGDKAYKTYTLDLGILGATAFYGPPRTYGVNVSYHW
ncbi:MAG: TonB-dependent receptor [Gammaproteobacteria bacterium]|nr:TonB-dependent receptor [Gammaproteobacteria bacterium]